MKARLFAIAALTALAALIPMAASAQNVTVNGVTPLTFDGDYAMPTDSTRPDLGIGGN